MLLNGYFLEHQWSGIGLVTRELYKEFVLQTKEECEVLLMQNPSKEVQEFLIQHELQYVVLPKPRWVPSRFHRIYWEMVQLPEYMRSYAKHRVYFSTYAHPMYRTPFAVDTVMMLHDIFPWKYKEYSNGLLRKILNFTLGMYVRFSPVRLVTVSETSKHDIESYLAPKNSVEVIPNGVDHLLNERLLSTQELDEKWGITFPYLFYLGGYDVRKNVPGLIQIFKQFRKTHPEAMLVLGGNALFSSSLYTDIGGYIDGVPNIIHTGFLSLGEMRSLFHHAHLFVHASKDEGSNIPVGESLCEGTPVAISDIPVHRELWGKEMYPVDFTDAVKGARMLKDAFEDAKKTTPKILYSWKTTAQSFLQLLSR